MIVSDGDYDVGKALHFVVYHAAELDLYLGVIPVAAAIVLTARARSLDRPLQVLLAVTITLSAWTLVVVGTFASRFADRIQERNMFALAPLVPDPARSRGSSAGLHGPRRRRAPPPPRPRS